MVVGLVAAALPAIFVEFSNTANAAMLARLVLTMPGLLIALIAPIAGYIVDRFGRKRIIVISTIMYGLSGVAGYFAPSMIALLLSRAVIGISVAGLMTGITTLVADYYEGEARAQFMGLQAGVMGLAGTAFFAIGGILADIGWRVPFLLYLGAFGVLLLIIFYLFEPLPIEKCAEAPSALSDPASCVAESLRAQGEGEPPIPLDTALPRGLIFFIYAVMIGIQMIFYFIPVQLPFFLQDLTGANASQSGLAIAGMSFAFALASLQYSRIAARFDHFQVVNLSFIILAVAYLFIALASGWLSIMVGLLLGGVGLGFLIPNLNVWVANVTPPAMRGRVLGGLTTAVFLGQFLSPLVGQPVSTSVGLSGLYLAAAIILFLMVPVFLASGRQLRALAT
jgi:MFS family permease